LEVTTQSVVVMVTTSCWGERKSGSGADTVVGLEVGQGCG
jgi:hypothetical protein